MESNPSYATSVQTDASGNWQYTLPSNLPVGMRHIIVQDEQGNEQTLSLYVDHAGATTTPTIHKESEIIHSNQLSFVMGGLIIVFGLVLTVFFPRTSLLRRKGSIASKKKGK